MLPQQPAAFLAQSSTVAGFPNFCLLTLTLPTHFLFSLPPPLPPKHPPQLGIIPTDSLPAVVCDLSNKSAALKLYNVMELAPKKQLSILVGGFNDISTYTTGFPIPTQPGEPDWFGVARRLLPGPVSAECWGVGGLGCARRVKGARGGASITVC